MAKRQINLYTEIVLTCSEAFHYRGEMIVEDHSLVRIVSGALKIVQSGNTYRFEAGDTLLFPKHQLTTLIKNEKDGLPFQAVVMKLTTAYLSAYYAKNKLAGHKQDRPKVIPLPKNPLLDSLFVSLNPYFNLEMKLPEDISAMKTNEAIAILRTVHKDIDSILSDFSEIGKINLADYMEANYMFNIPIEKFAYLTGRSLTTFKRDFKKTFNSTPQKWLTQKRLALAYHQLTVNNRKPAEVYYEAGFENLSHFSYAFKKQFGYPPTEIN